MREFEPWGHLGGCIIDHLTQAPILLRGAGNESFEVKVAVVFEVSLGSFHLFRRGEISKHSSICTVLSLGTGHVDTVTLPLKKLTTHHSPPSLVLWTHLFLTMTKRKSNVRAALVAAFAAALLIAGAATATSSSNHDNNNNKLRGAVGVTQDQEEAGSSSSFGRVLHRILNTGDNNKDLDTHYPLFLTNNEPLKDDYNIDDVFLSITLSGSKIAQSNIMRQPPRERKLAETAADATHGEGDGGHGAADDMVVHVTYESIYAILVFLIAATALGIVTSKLGMVSCFSNLCACLMSYYCVKHVSSLFSYIAACLSFTITQSSC